MVAGKMNEFRNSIPKDINFQKIAQELADTMVQINNPLNYNPLTNTADDIYAKYILFMMEFQPTLAAFILAPLTDYGNCFDEDDPTRCTVRRRFMQRKIMPIVL
jgi:hypothetical protein